MNDLWLARISSLSNEVGLYVVLLEVLLFMPNSLIIPCAIEDTINRKSQKDRENNDQKKMNQRTNNEFRNSTQQTKDRVKRTSLEPGLC